MNAYMDFLQNMSAAIRYARSLDEEARKKENASEDIISEEKASGNEFCENETSKEKRNAGEGVSSDS